MDNIDKLLGEYTVKRRTNRWFLALFYNIIDIAVWAAYIEHNPQLLASDTRRNLWKPQLFHGNIEATSKNSIVTLKLHVRYAMRDVLDHELRLSMPSGSTISTRQIKRYSTGRVAVVGTCFFMQRTSTQPKNAGVMCD